MKELFERWRKNVELRRKKQLEASIKWEAAHRYNIVLDGECYLTLDGERISSDYKNDYNAACRELFLLRAKYESERLPA